MRLDQEYRLICDYYKHNPASTLGYEREEYERHHIIPKHLGGTDEPENIVELPFEKHRYVHLLLHRMFPEDRGLQRAYISIMRRGCWGGKNSPRYGKKHSKEACAKMSEARRGKKKSEETKARMSEANRGRKHSEETRAKMSEARRGEKNPRYGKKGYWSGKKRSEETKAKIGEALRGKKLSEEARAKMSEAKRGKYVGEKSPRFKLLTTEEIKAIQQFSDWLDVGSHGIRRRLMKQGINISANRIKRLQEAHLGM